MKILRIAEQVMVVTGIVVLVGVAHLYILVDNLIRSKRPRMTAAKVAMAIIGMTSCGTTREVDRRSIQEESYRLAREDKTSVTSKEETFRIWAQSHWRDVDIRMLVYDTEKGDSTGSSPLLADITIRSKEETTEGAFEETDSVKDSASTSKIQEEDNTRSETHRDVRTTIGGRTRTIIIVALATMSIVALVIKKR